MSSDLSCFVVSPDGIEDDDEPAHTGDERPACRFLPAARSFAVVSGDNRVGAALDQGGRVECGAHGRPAAGDGAAGRAACPGSTFAGVVRRSRARVGARESGQVRSTWRRGGAVEALGSHRGGAVLMPQPAPSASLGFAALGDGGAQTKVSATPSRQHQGPGNARQRRATTSRRALMAAEPESPSRVRAARRPWRKGLLPFASANWRPAASRAIAPCVDRPALLRRQRDQACLPDTARPPGTKFSAKLERGADRLPSRRPLRCQGRAAQSRHVALGPDPCQGHSSLTRSRCPTGA